MALLDARAAAAVIGVSITQLRLFLAREGRGILPPSVQGRQRPIPDAALLPITLAFLLARDLGAPLSATTPLALKLLAEGSDAATRSLELSRTVTLRVDLQTLRDHLRASVAERLETAPEPPRRGRPPAKSKAGRPSRSAPPLGAWFSD